MAIFSRVMSQIGLGLVCGVVPAVAVDSWTGNTARGALTAIVLPAVALTTAAVGCAGEEHTGASGTVIEPKRDPDGRLIYEVNFGGVSNLNNVRLPDFARIDARATWRPHGARSRWEYYVEVINVLNRENASAMSANLAYDRTSGSTANLRRACWGPHPRPDDRGAVAVLTFVAHFRVVAPSSQLRIPSLTPSQIAKPSVTSGTSCCRI
jgi:hypothetical protein